MSPPAPSPAPTAAPLRTPGLGDDLPRPLERTLREAVFEHVASETDRIYPARLHVGLPGGPTTVRTLTESGEDHGLRADIVSAMVTRAGVARPLVWITRTGELPDVQDVDQQWLAASVAAFAELELSLIFVTVNRHGWRDPRSGTERSWVRPRIAPRRREQDR